jgi:predicted small integral membrane protein
VRGASSVVSKAIGQRCRPIARERWRSSSANAKRSRQAPNHARAPWRAAYAAIIAAEGITGLLFLLGAFRLFQLRKAEAAEFNAGKTYVIAACLLAFLVWFFGFMVVAGEWFAMWQSATWNGQEAAFRFYVAVLGVLIFVNQPDADL